MPSRSRRHSERISSSELTRARNSSGSTGLLHVVAGSRLQGLDPQSRVGRRTDGDHGKEVVGRQLPPQLLQQGEAFGLLQPHVENDQVEVAGCQAGVEPGAVRTGPHAPVARPFERVHDEADGVRIDVDDENPGIAICGIGQGLHPRWSDGQSIDNKRGRVFTKAKVPLC